MKIKELILGLLTCILQTSNATEPTTLPRVLIIGDSISIGYTKPLTEMLEGRAIVVHNTGNAQHSAHGLKNLEKWLGDGKWDVIHFNHGLHDLKYMGPNNENLADPKGSKSHQQVPPAEYESNLKTIAEKLKKTGAVVIWCETTPVPEGAKGRVVGDSKKYNEVAAKVMKELGEIKTNPLWQLSNKEVPTRPANVHYTAEGSNKLADQVVSVIKENLPQSDHK